MYDKHPFLALVAKLNSDLIENYKENDQNLQGQSTRINEGRALGGALW